MTLSQRGVAGPSISEAGPWALGVWGQALVISSIAPVGALHTMLSGQRGCVFTSGLGPGSWDLKTISLAYSFSLFWGPHDPMGRRGVGGIRCPCVPVCTQSSSEDQLLSLYIIYTVGYALSFSALIIASAILLGFR